MAFVYICLQSLIHYFGFAVWNKGTQGNAYPLFPVINKHNYTSTISVVIYRCLYYKIDTNCLQLDSIKNNVPLPVSQCFFSVFAFIQYCTTRAFLHLSFERYWLLVHFTY